MPRRPRLASGGIAYHVLNRRVGRLPLFEKPVDYSAFEKVLGEAYQRTNVDCGILFDAESCGRVTMENFPRVMRWITVTHTQRWHAHRHSSGSGPVYQGRFKSFPVQTHEQFLTVARYVERNALRAGLVGRSGTLAVVGFVAVFAGRWNGI